MEVWLAVGSSAGKAAVFNCPLLWHAGGEGGGGGRGRVRAAQWFFGLRLHTYTYT